MVARRPFAGVPLGARRRPPQIWMLSLDGGEPRRITNLLNGASAFQWSPDGRTSSASAAADRATRRNHRATSATTRTPTTSSTTPAGSTTSGRTSVVDRRRRPAPPSRSPTATTGTTPIRNGRRTAARIAFVSDRTGKEFDVGHNTDVWVIARGRRRADEDFRSRQPATTRRAGRPTARRSRS